MELSGVFLLIISIHLFAGNFIWRASKSVDYLTLPFTDLFSSDEDYTLDACCGSGRTTIALSKVLKKGRIVAFDRFDASYIKGGGMKLFEDNIKLAGIQDRVEIVKGDVTDIHLKDGTFDSAVSTYALDHLTNKATALKELNRVLKPGGRFLLVVFVPNIYTFLVANMLCLHLTSRKEWRQLFSETGFETIDEGAINVGAYFLARKKKAFS
ncbi:MAG: class I SAM-dependent methyltransferase [Candidatus Altiarchaeota archaeon]